MLDTGRLNIGTYYLSPQASTPEHVRDLAQCGIDVVVNMRNDRAALDLLEQSGVKAIVSGIVPGVVRRGRKQRGYDERKEPASKIRARRGCFSGSPGDHRYRRGRRTVLA